MDGTRSVQRIAPVVLVVAALASLHAQDAPSAGHPAGRAHREFVTAVAGGDLVEARRHMSRALIESLPAAGGLAKVCATRVGPGSIRGVQTVSTRIDGDTAQVSYRIHLSDGSTRSGTESLVFEDGAWKLDVLRPGAKRHAFPQGARGRAR